MSPKKKTARPRRRLSEYASLRYRLRIDRDDLDREVADQPELYHQAAEAHVQAISMRDQAKARLAEVESTEAARLRAGGSSITAANSEARLTSDYRDAQNVLGSADLEARKWEALRESIRLKGYALRELVEMWVARHVPDSVTVNEGRGRIVSRGSRRTTRN